MAIIIFLQTCLGIVQARSQVLSFGEVKYISVGQIFVIIVCLKQSFLSRTKFGVAQNKLGGTSPECPSMATGLASFSW